MLHLGLKVRVTSILANLRRPKTQYHLLSLLGYLQHTPLLGNIHLTTNRVPLEGATPTTLLTGLGHLRMELQGMDLRDIICHRTLDLTLLLSEEATIDPIFTEDLVPTILDLRHITSPHLHG